MNLLHRDPIYTDENGHKHTNHYGIRVDSETPVTGVLSNNGPEWLHEDIWDGIDLDFEEHCRECPEEDHDFCWESLPSDTILVGGWLHDEDTGQYTPDPEAEYSAITGEIYTQVVASKYTRRCALCSPCYPGQGDLDTPGAFLAYDLPPEVWGDAERD